MSRSQNRWQAAHLVAAGLLIFTAMGQSECDNGNGDVDGDGFTEAEGDCNDRNPTIYPGAPELCDSLDNNCNGEVDEGVADQCVTPLEGEYTLSSSQLKVYGNDNDALGVYNSVGDVNGDGIDDLILRNGRGGNSFLFYGPLEGGTLSSSEADVVISSERGSKGMVSIKSDINGDGRDDVVISDYQAYSEGEWASGAVHVFFGPLTRSTTLLDADVIIGSVLGDERFGWSMDTGDINGDGLDDVLVGANYAGVGDEMWAGAAYIFNGPLTSLDGSGFIPSSLANARLMGEDADDNAGTAVAVVGDTNGDGFGDVLVGAPYAEAGDTQRGRTYLLHGPLQGEGTLRAAVATFDGEGDFEHAGEHVSWVGDVNQDGRSDLLIGSSDASKSYLILSPVSGSRQLSNADARFYAPSGTLGGMVFGVGDMDGDGASDIAIGAPYAYHAANASGAAYLSYAPFASTQNLESSADMLVKGEAELTYTGINITSGDLNNDGRKDLVIGAFGDPGEGYNVGAGHVFFGQ